MKKLKPNKTSFGVYLTHKKILKFQSPNDYISDDDIFDLFIGLMNLIKKSTELKVENKYIYEINHLKKELELAKNKK